jgi:hypothetical protein
MKLCRLMLAALIIALGAGKLKRAGHVRGEHRA